MSTYYDFEKWLIKHREKVAEYASQVAEYEKMYKAEGLSGLINAYTNLNRDHILNLEETEAAMREAAFNVLVQWPKDELIKHREELGARIKENKVWEIKYLKEKIQWCDYFIECDQPKLVETTAGIPNYA